MSRGVRPAPSTVMRRASGWRRRPVARSGTCSVPWIGLASGRASVSAPALGVKRGAPAVAMMNVPPSTGMGGGYKARNSNAAQVGCKTSNAANRSQCGWGDARCHRMRRMAEIRTAIARIAAVTCSIVMNRPPLSFADSGRPCRRDVSLARLGPSVVPWRSRAGIADGRDSLRSADSGAGCRLRR